MSLLSFVVLALAPAALLAAQEPQGASLPPAEGQRFPDLGFPLLQPDGSLGPELHGLDDWRGRKVLLIQFASW